MKIIHLQLEFSELSFSKGGAMHERNSNPFLMPKPVQSSARNRRLRNHLMLVATLAVTTIAIAITGTAPHFV